jgi:hypothetical protein
MAVALTKDEICTRVETLIDEAIEGDLTYAEIRDIIVSRVDASMAARRAANILRMANDPAVQDAMRVVHEIRRNPQNGPEIIRQLLERGGH